MKGSALPVPYVIFLTNTARVVAVNQVSRSPPLSMSQSNWDGTFLGAVSSWVI